jgi:protease-4
MARKCLGFLLVPLLCILGPLPTEAQEYKQATSGVLLPSPWITETVDATALAVNPANLAFLDSWNLTYVGAWLSDQTSVAGQGHGFFFAFPAGPLGFGVAVEPLFPPDATKEWQGLDNRARFSLGMAFQFRRVASLGIVYRTFWSAQYGDLNTFDIGLSVRPINHLALSFVMSDLNSPTYKFVDRDEATDTSVVKQNEAPRKFDVALTVRPLGNDRLSLGGDLMYIYGSGDYQRTDAGAMLTGMIFDGLTLRMRFGAQGIRDEANETGYFLDGSVTLDLPGFGVGASFNGQLAPDDDNGYLGTSWFASFHGDEGPALTLPRPIRANHTVIFDIDKKMGGYGLARLTAMFERMQRDRSVDTVVLRPEPDTLSLSDVREVRKRIHRLRQTGRKVICYLTEATTSVYLACAAADEVWINPAGGIRMAGLSSRRLYFKELFDKIGVKADIVRIGEFKSAPEAFTRTGPSEPSAEQTNRYLDSIYHQILADLSRDRSLDGVEGARLIVEQGPFTAPEALSLGLVDSIVPTDELEKELRDLAGGHVFLDRRYGKTRLRHRRYLDAPAVAVVHIEGDLIDGESFEIPFLNIKMTGAKTITEILRKLREDNHIRAVVLRINSPGGSALASDIIWREVMALREEKQVIASLGSIAASGGYYIASAANEIISEPTSVTGSIGVFYGKADLSGLMDKIGVNITTYRRGAHADAQSWTREYTPEERKKLQNQIEQYYKLFKDRVVAGRGRGFTPEIVEKLARGRVWSGSDAHRNLMVDALGSYSDAVARAREVGRVPADIPVFQYPKQKRGLLMRLLTSMYTKTETMTSLEALMTVTGMNTTLKATLPFALGDSDAPRARLPFQIIE